MSVDTWSSSNSHNICSLRWDPPCWKSPRPLQLLSLLKKSKHVSTTQLILKILLSRWGTLEEQPSLRSRRVVPSSHSNRMPWWFPCGPFCGCQKVRVDLLDLLVTPNVETSERLVTSVLDPKQSIIALMDFSDLSHYRIGRGHPFLWTL